MEIIQPNREEIIQLLIADMRIRKLLIGLNNAGLSADAFNTDLLPLLNMESMAQVTKETFVEESGFIISDNIQSMYTATYRDGNCYNGYVKTEYSSYEIILVDYYEKGMLKYQYSKKFDPENYVSEEKIVLDLKSTYKDGVIFTGTEYAFINKGLVCKIWKEGNLENFTVHMFAMHYYNRLVFERKDSIIRITNMLEKRDEITYNYSNDLMTSELKGAEGTMRLSMYTTIDVLHLPPSSLIFYIKFGNEMVCKSKRIHNDEERQQFHVNTQVYGNLKMPKSGNSYSAFLGLAEYFSKPEALDKIFYADELPVDEQEEVPEEYIVAIMDTDSTGAVRNGIRWVNTTQSYYEEYMNGELIKKEHIDIQDFQKTATVFYESMMAVQEK